MEVSVEGGGATIAESGTSMERVTSELVMTVALIAALLVSTLETHFGLQGGSTFGTPPDGLDHIQLAAFQKDWAHKIAFCNWERDFYLDCTLEAFNL